MMSLWAEVVEAGGGVMAAARRMIARDQFFSTRR
jgi:hypothetical protein